MNLVSIVFLLLEVLIVGLGVFIGYKRGLGRSTVRMVYLAVIGVASFFIARYISFAVSTPIYNFVFEILPSYDIQHLLEKSHELELLIENIIGALLTPVVFALLFAVLQLLTLICFKKISSKIVSALTSKSSETPNATSKWLGAGVGFVSAVAVAAILLSPVYTAIHVIDNTSEETVAIFFDAAEDNGAALDAEFTHKALKAQITTVKFDIKPSFAVTKFHPISDFISNTATKYTVPEAHEKESASHSLPVLVDVIADVLYVHDSTIDHGGSSMDALSNSVASVTPHLGESITVKDAVASALCALGEILIEDKEFMGIALPTNQNMLVEGITNNILDTLSHTTLNTVNDNMIMLFGTVSDELMPEHKRHNVLDPGYSLGEYDGSSGLLTTMEELKSNSSDPQAMLNKALALFGNNPEITNMINEMLAEYIAASMPEDIDIGKDTIKEILDNSDLDLSEIDITNITKEDIKDIVTSGDIVLDENTLDAIRDYLGDDSITKEDVDKFLQDGNLGDHFGDVDLGDIDLGDVDLGDIDLGDVDLGDVDLGDVDLGDVDLGDVDLSDIDINSIDFTTLTPEQIDALRAKYGDIVDIYLN